MRTPILAQEGDHRFHRRLFVEIFSGLGQQGNRSASIHKIADLDHMLALALRTLLRRDGAHILANPSGSLPTALEARWDGAALWNGAPDSLWYAESSRSFDWSGAEESVRLAVLGHEEGSRAGLEGQAPASSSLAEQSASPQSLGRPHIPAEVGRMMGSRSGAQQMGIMGITFCEPLAPFFDPTHRAACDLGQFPWRSLRGLLQQIA